MDLSTEHLPWCDPACCAGDVHQSAPVQVQADDLRYISRLHSRADRTGRPPLVLVDGYADWLDEDADDQPLWTLVLNPHQAATLTQLLAAALAETRIPA